MTRLEIFNKLAKRASRKLLELNWEGFFAITKKEQVNVLNSISNYYSVSRNYCVPNTTIQLMTPLFKDRFIHFLHEYSIYDTFIQLAQNEASIEWRKQYKHNNYSSFDEYLNNTPPISFVLEVCLWRDSGYDIEGRLNELDIKWRNLMKDLWFEEFDLTSLYR